MRLDGQRVLITGGAGHLAEAVAGVLAAAGAELILADLPGSGVKARATAMSGLALVADLTDPAAATAIAQLGPIDGLIHTAGGFAMAPAAEVELDSFQRMVDINLRTLVVATKGVLPGMIEQGSGLICGIAASPAWTGAGPGMAAYAAAKSGVATYLASMDGELGASDVRTLVVYPMGVIDTETNRRAMPDADPDEWIDPAEIGQAILFAATRSRRCRLLELPLYPARSGG